MGGPWIRRLIALTALACGLMVVLTGGSEAQLLLYDNFTGPLIHPAKWRGDEVFAAGDNPNAEAMRYITGGQLRVVLRTYGAPFTNTGTQDGRFGLKLSNPELVTAMATTVTVISASAQVCTTNTASTITRARLAGYFFNDGTSQRVGDGTGDVSAGISIQRTINATTPAVNQIVAFISRCTDWDCFMSTSLARVTFATPWTLTVPVTLEMTWDATNNRFVFKATPTGGATETRLLTYAVSDTDPPQDFDFKRIVVYNTVANCAAGRKLAAMDVRFDNFKINP